MPAGRFDSKEYGDVHRRLVQVLISRGCIKGVGELKSVFSQCLLLAGVDLDHVRNDSQVDVVKLAVNTINTIRSDPRFKATRLSIEKITSEYDSEGPTSYYVLVNRMKGGWTKALSLQSETESEMLKLVLTAITASPDASISTVDFLNFVDDLREKNRKISKGDAQKLQDSLVKRQWLEKIDGQIRLHPRGIAELKPYLQETLNVPACEMCRELVLASGRTQCRGEECGARVHQHCMRKYTNEGNTAKCPRPDCGVDWPHPLTAAPPRAAEKRSKERQNPQEPLAQPSHNKRRVIVEDEDD